MPSRDSCVYLLVLPPTNDIAVLGKKTSLYSKFLDTLFTAGRVHCPAESVEEEEDRLATTYSQLQCLASCQPSSLHLPTKVNVRAKSWLRGGKFSIFIIVSFLSFSHIFEQFFFCVYFCLHLCFNRCTSLAVVSLWEIFMTRVSSANRHLSALLGYLMSIHTS